MDEALDQLLLGRVVECLDHDVVRHRAGDADDLGAQLVAAATGCRVDVGLGAGFELGELGLEPRPAVDEQRLRLGVGVGEQPRALGLDVALGPADRGGVGVGIGDRVGAGIELAWIRAVRSANPFLIGGPAN